MAEPFNPDQFLADTSNAKPKKAKKFDPEKFLAITDGLAEPAPTAAPATTRLEAFGRGAAQGATLGFGEELSPFVEKGIARVSKLTGIGPQGVAQQVLETPREELVEENIEELRQTRAEQPGAFGLGKFVGTVGATAPLGLVGQTVKGAAGLAGAISGVQAVGESEDEGLDRLGAAVVPAIFGGATGALLKGVSPQWLKKQSEGQAIKALGFIKSTIKKVGGVDKAREAARVLLDKGAIKGSLGTMAKNVQALRDTSGKLIGDTLDKLDDAGLGAIDMSDVAAKFSAIAKESADEPALSSLVPQINKFLASIEKRGTAATFASAQKLKKVFQGIGWKKGGGADPANEFAQKAYLLVRDAIDDAVEKAAPLLGSPKLAKEFMDAKVAYSAAKTAEKGIENALQSATGNRAIGLTDIIFASGELSGGKPGTAATLLLGKKLVESKTAKSIAARGLGVAAKIATPLAPLSPLAGPVGGAVGTSLADKIGIGGR